jgi:hypothetical protein
VTSALSRRLDGLEAGLLGLRLPTPLDERLVWSRWSTDDELVELEAMLRTAITNGRDLTDAETSRAIECEILATKRAKGPASRPPDRGAVPCPRAQGSPRACSGVPGCDCCKSREKSRSVPLDAS